LFNRELHAHFDDEEEEDEEVITLGLLVHSVVSAVYFPHMGDSRVYIELSGNG
jgi:hypothetical protein